MYEQVKQRRKEMRLSQSELAEISGVSRMTISNIERGRTKSLNTLTVYKLAKALDCPVDLFFSSKCLTD